MLLSHRVDGRRKCRHSRLAFVLFDSSKKKKKAQNFEVRKKSSLISMPLIPSQITLSPQEFESRDVAVCCGLGTAVRKLSKQLVQAYNQNIFFTSDSWQNKACSQKGKVLITKPPVQPSEANPAFGWFPVGNGAFRGTMLSVPNIFHISQHCIIRGEINSSQKQAPPHCSSSPFVIKDEDTH